MNDPLPAGGDQRRQESPPQGRRTERERFFREYLLRYTNAATLVTDEYRDAEEGAGLFAGFDPRERTYDVRKWRYDTEAGRPPGQPEAGEGRGQSFAATVGQLVGPDRLTERAERELQ